MAAEPRDEFYIGWEPHAPAGIRSRLRLAVAALAAFALLLAVALSSLQNPLPVSSFEFGTTREFVGWVAETPYPALLVAAQGPATHPVRFSRYTLAESGTKFGAQQLASGFDGQLVRLQGTLIYRNDQTMIDVVPGSLTPVSEPAETQSDGRGEELGRFTLRGEIVDTKCYFGVMNPATGKVHRACAARCISSGIPPALLLRDRGAGSATLLLVDSGGANVNERVLHMVAESVEITGRVKRLENILVLYADPEHYRRLN